MRKRSILAAAGLAAATIIGALAPPTTASAGDGIPVYVTVNVMAPDASAVMDALTLEVWEIEGESTTLVEFPTCAEPVGSGGVLADTDFSVNCGVPTFGDYAIGVSGVPDGATATAECSTDTFNLLERIPGTGAQFTIDESGEYGECTIFVVQPTIFVDKIVETGVAAPDDFTIQVFSGGTEVASGTDTSADSCVVLTTLTSGDCAAITVPAGDLQLGESGPTGYVPSNVGCVTFRPDLPIQIPGDVFPAGIGELTLSDQAQGDTMAYCEITNRYYEGELVVTKSVTNDDGGTLGPADFTAEVYTEPGGSLVTSGECDANGDCIDITLPIGDYRIGEADTNGYTPSVTCTVTREPTGPGDIGTVPPTTIGEINFEAIPGTDAVATVEPGGEVTCEIVNDDPTTTTTTTTMAPTTTDQGGGGAVPTTVTPTLPPTGDSNAAIAILAALFVALGSTLLVARRRTT